MNVKIAVITLVVLANISSTIGAPQFETITNFGQAILSGIQDIVSLPGQFFSSAFGSGETSSRPNRQTVDSNGNQFDSNGNFVPGTPLGR